jgi:hypothetical protein
MSGSFPGLRGCGIGCLSVVFWEKLGFGVLSIEELRPVVCFDLQLSLSKVAFFDFQVIIVGFPLFFE